MSKKNEIKKPKLSTNSRTLQIESLVHTTKDKDHSFLTIEKEDLIFLLNKLCQVDHKRMIQHIIFLANCIVKKQDCIYTFHDLIEAIDELIQKLMRDDRE